jgi:threonine/homoserine/homoserine lactone efflux protein
MPTDLSFLPANLLLMYSVYLIGTASPGPSNMSIMAVAIQRGRKPAMVLASGVITGSITWGLLAGFGLATALAMWGNVFVALKLVGGLYLLWLAYRAGRSALTRTQASRKYADSFGVTNRQLYLRGAAMHLTNPKAIFSWAATISVGLPSSPSTHDVLIALSGCFCLGILTFFGYAFLFSTVTAQRAFVGTRRWFEGILAVIYGYAGMRLLLSKLNSGAAPES